MDDILTNFTRALKEVALKEDSEGEGPPSLLRRMARRVGVELRGGQGQEIRSAGLMRTLADSSLLYIEVRGKLGLLASAACRSLVSWACLPACRSLVSWACWTSAARPGSGTTTTTCGTAYERSTSWRHG